MSRGHKIVANFLKKRGAWDNNPYKETEMKKELPPPFEPDKKPKKFATAGKAGYGPSAARHLAQLGLKQQMLKVNPKLAESWDTETLNALSKITKLTKEAVSYSGLGTDVVDKKKKLNPQPNLMMKPKQVKDFKEEALIEGKMKDIYTDMMDHATKKGYASHKEFTPADYETVGKLHGISGKELAVLAGHKTAAQVTKEENIAELKASTLQSYADKAHQQALDATYDAAHLNRSGEEKLKADAKRLASKRAGGVQMAQTKLDRMKESLDLSHGIGDTVRCKRTNRMATVAGFDNDKYTVVYADGSTETGPADWWTSVTKITHSNGLNQDTITNEQAVAPVVKNYYKGIRLHFARGNRGGKSGSNKGGPASDSSADAGDGGSGGDGGGV
jgi:hypothetical protein